MWRINLRFHRAGVWQSSGRLPVCQVCKDFKSTLYVGRMRRNLVYTPFLIFFVLKSMFKKDKRWKDLRILSVLNITKGRDNRLYKHGYEIYRWSHSSLTWKLLTVTLWVALKHLGLWHAIVSWKGGFIWNTLFSSQRTNIFHRSLLRGFWHFANLVTSAVTRRRCLRHSIPC